MAVASASVTARTYCDAVSSRVNVGPISKLNVGSGLNVSPTLRLARTTIRPACVS